jgi:hypothetical protein
MAAPEAPVTTPDKGNGQFTGADLAEIVKPGADLTKLGGTPLKDWELEALLASRIAGGPEPGFTIGGTDDWERARDIAEVIVDALPPELHTDAVANGLDYRPYLVALDGKKIIFRSDVAGPFPDIKKTKTISTKGFQAAAETKAQEDAVVAGAGGQTPVSTKYDPAQAGIVPTATAAPVVDPTTGQVSTPGVTIGPNGEISFGTSAGGSAAASPFTLADLRQMVQGDHWTLEQLAQNEDQAPGGQFPIDIGLPGTTRETGGPAITHTLTEPTLSTNDALSYLRTSLTPQEIHSMQLKLASAGYFDKLGNGGGYIDGVVDDSTQAAWKLLLTDSVIQNRSAPTILGEGLKNYREQVRKSRLGQLSAMDPSYSRLIGNDYAQSVIGRNLDTQEMVGLNNYLQGLRNTRAGYVAGTDNPAGPLVGDETGQGYSSRDVQTYLSTRTDEEQRIQNMQAYRFQLSKAMK